MSTSDERQQRVEMIGLVKAGVDPDDPTLPDRLREVADYLDLIATLRAARQLSGLTTEQVAERSGLTARQVSSVEILTDFDPHLSTLQRYARAVGVAFLFSIHPAPEGAAGNTP